MSEAVAGATTDASLEAQCSEERISGGKGLARSQGRRVLNLFMPARAREVAYYGSGGGRGKIGSWCKL